MTVQIPLMLSSLTLYNLPTQMNLPFLPGYTYLRQNDPFSDLGVTHTLPSNHSLIIPPYTSAQLLQEVCEMMHSCFNSYNNLHIGYSSF